MLFVEAYKRRFDLPEDSIVIDTTSRSGNWTRGFSPFIIPGGYLYDNYYAKSVENAWQASKVFPQFVDENNNPTPEYFAWAKNIWTSSYAFRYPMDRSLKPLYSWWNGQKYDYVDARKKIYIPLYSRGVLKTKAFETLLDIYRKTDKDIYLVDFDGYNHKKMGLTLKDVANNPKKSMGHAFIIYDLLQRHKNDLI
jgi:hypothetical protein